MGLGDTYFAEGTEAGLKIADAYEKGIEKEYDRQIKRMKSAKIDQEMLEDALLGNSRLQAMEAEYQQKINDISLLNQERVLKRPPVSVDDAQEMFKQLTPEQIEEYKKSTPQQRNKKLEEWSKNWKKYGSISTPSDSGFAYGESDGMNRAPTGVQRQPGFSGIQQAPITENDLIIRDPTAVSPEDPYLTEEELAGLDAQLGEWEPSTVEGTPGFTDAVGAGLAKVGDWLKVPPQEPAHPAADLFKQRRIGGYIPAQSAEEYRQRYPERITDAELRLGQAEIQADLSRNKAIFKALSDAERAKNEAAAQAKAADDAETRTGLEILGKMILEGKKAKTGSAKAGPYYAADQRKIKEFADEYQARKDRYSRFGDAGLKRAAKEMRLEAQRTYKGLSDPVAKREFADRFSDMLGDVLNVKPSGEIKEQAPPKESKSSPRLIPEFNHANIGAKNRALLRGTKRQHKKGDVFYMGRQKYVYDGKTYKPVKE